MKVGPKTYIRQDNEKVILGPEKMIVVPPRHYCIVENPAVVDKDGQVVYDTHGQVSWNMFTSCMDVYLLAIKEAWLVVGGFM